VAGAAEFDMDLLQRRTDDHFAAASADDLGVRVVGGMVLLLIRQLSLVIRTMQITLAQRLL
jgi:hypothetical protein